MHARRTLVLVGVPVALWYLTRAPFGWIGLWLGACAVVVGVRRRNRRAGVVAFNVGVACLAIGAVELGLEVLQPAEGRYAPSGYQHAYAGEDPVLGYGPVAGRSGRAMRFQGDEKLYDVVYTIGPDGLRAAPPAGDRPAKGSVLCFGCSYMFGEGLPDDRTLPWLLEASSGGRWRVHNFAFHGWGAHQMLANLESGRVAAKVAAPPRLAIFWTVWDHALRTAGKRRWDRRGPRYVLGADGRVRREGTFADLPQETWLERRVRKFLGRSRIHRVLARPDDAVLEEDDLALWVAVTARARDRVEATWPGCAFHVVLSDRDGAIAARVIPAFERAGLRVHPLSGILPGFREDPVRWSVHDRDPHPNAEAHAALARWIAANLLPPD